MYVKRPRKNRVTPFGTFEATHHKGLLLGNRGDLHNENGELGDLPWKRKAWISCRLNMGSRRIVFDKPGRYYPLFFMDEAVAFAAGHRPCGRCRTEKYLEFKRIWKSLNGYSASCKLSNSEMDEELHVDRMRKMNWEIDDVLSMPSGTFVSPANNPDKALLVWGQQVFEWQWDRYKNVSDIAVIRRAKVLTPKTYVSILAAGYQLGFGQ